LAKIDADGWHAVYIEPQVSPLAAFLGGAVPTAKQAAVPMDLFARASWEQQESLNRMQHDLGRLSGVRGAQVSCLDCGVIAGTPVTKIGMRNSGGWLATMMRFVAG
jgi:hypothetical protein